MDFDKNTANLLAAASQVVYQGAAEVTDWGGKEKLTMDLFPPNPIDTQGFTATSESSVLLVFRGTEPKNIRDWMTDAQAVRVPSPAGGSVHQGFSRALDAVWGHIQGTLAKHKGKRLVISGHSLGGGLAVLAASRLPGVPLSLYTFGQPRVGNEEFAKACDTMFGGDYFRLVNDKDIVPRVPPFTAGYRHFGQEIEIDSKRNVREVDFGVETAEDAIRLAVGSSVVVPKAVNAFIPQILELVDSVARGKNSKDAVIASIGGLLAFLQLFPGGGIPQFIRSLKDRTAALAAIQQNPGAFEPIADHDMALYRAGLQ
ncbi:MAG: lipase family protein [Bryobacterales bacterium]|nr:lipase family protein [Bryobacterales bacterium]